MGEHPASGELCNLCVGCREGKTLVGPILQLAICQSLNALFKSRCAVQGDALTLICEIEMTSAMMIWAA